MAGFKMAGFKAIICAGAIALGIINVAEAADLLPLPPPPPIEPVAAFGNWYIRGDVGVGINQLSEARSSFDALNAAGGAAPPVTRVNNSIGDSALVGIGVGYQVNRWLRFDATGEYRTSAAYKSTNTYTAFCGTGVCPDFYSGNVQSGVFLANVNFDLGTWYGVTPFVMGGVGGAIHDFRNLTDIGTSPTNAGYGFAANRSSLNFAWAVGAGLDFSITPNLKLELSYRYLDMGTVRSGAIACTDVPGCFNERQSFHLASNDIRLGFRYMFADYAPPLAPNPPPLVRKY